MVTLYGLPNCDKCRAARKWFDQSGIDYRFHDVRADGLDTDQLNSWVSQLGGKALVNTRSTTWRGLPDKDKQTPDDSNAAELIAAHPTLLKRPLADDGTHATVGYDEKRWQELFG